MGNFSMGARDSPKLMYVCFPSLSGCNWLQTNEDKAQREAGLDRGCFALTLIRANWRDGRPVRPLHIHRVLPDNIRVTKFKTNQLFSAGAEN